MKISRDVAEAWVAGLSAGLLGATAFLTAHGLIIVPIWQAAGGGALIATILGGSAMAWSFEELRHAGRLWLTFRSGLLFGALLWLLIVPMTVVGTIFRMSGIRPLLGFWEVVVEVAVAAGTGFLAGWVLARGIRPAAALGMTALVLSLVMGGPIPVVNSNRAAGLFAAFVVIYPIAGLGFVIIRRSLARLAGARGRAAILFLTSTFAVALASCDSTSPADVPPSKLPVGTWGGDNAGLIMNDAVAHVHVGCTYGDFPAPIALDADLRFRAPGEYLLQAYPVAVGPAMPAQFAGVLRDAALTLTVAVNDTVDKKLVVLGPVTVVLGHEPKMGPCPICKSPAER